MRIQLIVALLMSTVALPSYQFYVDIEYQMDRLCSEAMQGDEVSAQSYEIAQSMLTGHICKLPASMLVKNRLVERELCVLRNGHLELKHLSTGNCGQIDERDEDEKR